MYIPLRTTTLFDLPVVCERKEVVLNFLLEHLPAEHKKTDDKKSDALIVIATPNPEQVVQTQEYKQFKADLLATDILLPDGIGLVIASKILNLVRPVTPLPERIAGIDVVSDLLKWAKKEHQPVVVIGGRGYESYFADTGELGLFWTTGYQNIAQPTEREEEQIAELLKKTKPALVFVAFGAPFQERWLREQRDFLEKNGVQVAMAVGGTFDVVTGQLARPPEWLRRVGGEWLFRLIQQPWRWRRQLRLLTFVKLLVQEVLR